MERYNCLIIEDEPLGAEILEGYVNQIPFLKLICVCPDAISAINILQKEHVDVIFLDLHLPKIGGFDFLSTLKNPPKIIITTAYHEYALKSYDFGVVDYLLKPIEFSRFFASVSKLNRTSSSILPESENDDKYLFFNTNKKKIKIYIDSILYIESQKEYVKIFTIEKTIVTKMPITQVEELLKNDDFLRIHRSFIISRKKIEAYTASDVEIHGKLVPIGRSYKELVQNNLKHFE